MGSAPGRVSRMTFTNSQPAASQAKQPFPGIAVFGHYCFTGLIIRATLPALERCRLEHTLRVYKSAICVSIVLLLVGSC